MQNAVLEYLRDLRHEPLTDKQSDTFQALMSATVNLENLAGIINDELAPVDKRFIDLGVEPSEATRLLLTNLADKVSHAVDQVIQAVRDEDETAAEEVISVKDEVRRIADEFLMRQSERIGIQDSGHLDHLRDKTKSRGIATGRGEYRKY